MDAKTPEVTAFERLTEAQPPHLEAQKPVHPIKYRPDIDGLRALAVIPVVLFHAYPKSIRGGFIGVDVFFVISGYLISGILFKEHTKGTFTYADFYSRRIRRIFPALILMLLFTLIVGCVWLLAKPLKTMAATLVAGSLFGANLQLLTVEQGYFDDSVKANPLLHLWSLGVEEQFYIFWPLFASIVVHLSFRKAVASQILVIVASFTCNVLFLGFHNDNKYSFYFPLSRFWQMAIGGLLAYVSMPTLDGGSKTANLSSWLSGICSVLGFASIVVGYIVIEEEFSFPGWWALLPTLGTASMILAGPQTPLNKYLLGSAPAVFIGQISYALYLWHWPLLVFAKERYPNEDVRPWYMAPYSMMTVAVLLSVATLYIVENNLRRRKSKVLVPLLFSIVMAIAIVGIFVFKFPDTFSVTSRRIASSDDLVELDPREIDGIPNWSKGPRLKEATVDAVYKAMGDWHPWDNGYVFVDRTNAEADDDGIKVLNDDDSAPLVVVLGDSHANMLAPRFTRVLENFKQQRRSFPKIMFRTKDGTPPLSCKSGHAANVDFTLQAKPKVVLIGSDWIQWLKAGGTKSNGDNPPCCPGGQPYGPCENQSPEDRTLLLDRLADDITKMTQHGIKVFVVTSKPQGEEFSSRKLLNGNSLGSTKPVRRSEFRKTHDAVISEVEDMIRSVNATIIDLTDNQCYEDQCEVVSMREGVPMFKDTNHFRPFFVRNYLSVLDQVVEAATSAH